MFKPTGTPTDTPPAGYESQLDMKGRVIYWLLMQGLGVAVLAMWLYVQHLDLKEYKKNINACNEKLINAYEDQNLKLINALEEINHTLDKLHSSSNRKRY